MRVKKKFKMLILLTLILAGAYLSYNIYKVPYEVKPNANDVPSYLEESLDFTHEYKAAKSLPLTGSAAFDIDGDHQPEIFIGGGFLQRDALFTFKNDKFEDISQKVGLIKDFGDTSYGAASIDYNNDGYTDLFVTRDSGVYIYRNDNGFLHKLKLKINIDKHAVPTALTLSDLNSDNKVDIFITTHLRPAFIESYGIFNKRQYGTNSILLLNKGNNTFQDITQEAGLSYTHNALSAIFADLNNDRKPDLTVAYTAGNIRTYRNLGNLKFADMPNPTSEVYGYPMSLATGDYDNNGTLDIFATNVGTTVPALLARGDLRKNQPFNSKWMLLKNKGKFLFEEVADQVLLADYELGLGSVLIDLNLNGYQDLLVSTNFIDYPPHHFYKSNSKLFIQNAEGTFAPAQSEARLENKNFGSTPLTGDFNNDGFPDIVFVNINGPSKAYLSLGGERHFSKVILEDNPASLGAVVTLTTGTNRTITEHMISGEGLASDQSHAIIFGLNFETSIKKIKVDYLSGKSITIDRPPIDQTIIVADYKKRNPQIYDQTPASDNSQIDEKEWMEPETSHQVILEN